MTDLTVLSLVTAPAVMPISIDEVRLQCGLESNDHDELLEGYIAAATEYAETYTDRALILQTWDLTLDAFPAGLSIFVPRPPLLDVTWVKYTDAGGTLQTWDEASYLVDTSAYGTAQQGRISRVQATEWPVVRTGPNAVTIRFRAGYGTTGESVPMVIRVAMKQFIAEAWSIRANTVTGNISTPHQTTDRLLTGYRTSWL